MSGYVWGENETEFFFHLTPEVILSAIDQLGLKTTGRCLTLNSMENRVYEIEIEKDEEEIKVPSDAFVVAKFYRPGRWSKEQILEEHQFLLDLKNSEVPVIAPIKFKGETLFKLEGHNLFYTLFPKKGGRIPQEMTHEQLEIMGRSLARLHMIGKSSSSIHRLSINPTTFGRDNLNFLKSKNFIPGHQERYFDETISKICDLSDPLFENVTTHRIHGDCHLGNIIWRENEGPNFIDFDDMLTGPAVQDIWLICPGVDQYAINDRNVLIDSYQTMFDFDFQSLKLIEPLRALRYIHFMAWIAKRWADPAFKQAFPHFDGNFYWDTQLADLKAQLQKIENITKSALI